jgi:hypothetical protein
MPIGYFSDLWRPPVRPLHGNLFRMILEMFHVKHFCPIPAENLTSRTTARTLQ